jgi:hypothetical protein
MLGWTVVGAVPLGALVAFPVGLLLSRIGTAVTVAGVVVVLVAAEALMVYLVLRQTPRITVARGKMTVGRLLDKRGRSIPVQSISSVELARGSMAVLALTEGYMGEGRVLVHLVDGSHLELGWDAFAGQARTLAWLLGVSLTDSGHASRRRAAAGHINDPGRQKRRTILVYVAVAGVLIAVFALLFGPLLMSIFQMISRR